MMSILGEYLEDVLEYLNKAVHASKPIIIFIVTGINYVIFPTEAHVPAVISLVGALFIDILTKYYAISMKNGGFVSALRSGALSSNSLWKGTQRKIISYLVILILCGLSVRVSTLTQVSVLVSTTALAVLFAREAQSCMENLLEAGHTDVEWFLRLVKSKRKSIEDKELPKGGDNDGI